MPSAVPLSEKGPERQDSPRLTTFFAELLLEVFGDVFSSPPEIDGAHRALANRPRTVIIRLYYLQVKENIMRKACSRRGNLQYCGHPIAVYEDYALEVLEQRPYIRMCSRIYKMQAIARCYVPSQFSFLLPAATKKDSIQLLKQKTALDPSESLIMWIFMNICGSPWAGDYLTSECCAAGWYLCLYILLWLKVSSDLCFGHLLFY